MQGVVPSRILFFVLFLKVAPQAIHFLQTFFYEGTAFLIEIERPVAATDTTLSHRAESRL